MKPAYEIVRADELRMGDVVTIEPDLDPWVMDDVRLTDSHLFYRGDGQGTEFSMPRDRWVFRLLPPERNPDVLEGALQVAASQLFEATHVMMERKSPKPSADDVKHYIKSCIDRAISELESEAGDGTLETHN